MSEPTANTEPTKEAEPAAAPPAAAAEPAPAETKSEGAKAAPAAGAHDAPKPESAAKKAAAKLSALLHRVLGVLKEVPAVIKDLRQNFKARAVGFFKAIFSFPLLIIRGDWATRVLLFGFAASVALLALTSGQLYQRFGPRFGTKKPVAHVMTEAERLAEEQKALQLVAANLLYLDTFSTNLAVKGGAEQNVQIEMYVETDAPETAALLREHLPQVRETIATAIQGQVYEELVSEEGKTRFKSSLAEAINKPLGHWTAKGKVKQVYFTRLIMQ